MQERDRQNHPTLADLIIDAIDDADDVALSQLLSESGLELETLSKIGENWARHAIVTHGKARFARCQSEVAQRALLPRKPVALDYDSMLSIVRQHVANDPHSKLTLAARNQAGALTVDELRSLVEDIEALKGN